MFTIDATPREIGSHHSTRSPRSRRDGDPITSRQSGAQGPLCGFRVSSTAGRTNPINRTTHTAENHNMFIYIELKIISEHQHAATESICVRKWATGEAQVAWEVSVKTSLAPLTQESGVSRPREPAGTPRHGSLAGFATCVVHLAARPRPPLAWSHSYRTHLLNGCFPSHGRPPRIRPGKHDARRDSFGVRLTIKGRPK